MLLGNYSVLNKLPIRWRGGSASSPETTIRSNFGMSGALRNRALGSDTLAANKTFGLPSGSYPPYAWMLPQIPGPMAARNTATIAVTAAATGVCGMPGVGAATFTVAPGPLAGQLIVSGVGSSAFAVTTNTPALTASMKGVGSASLSISTNHPLLGAIAQPLASATFTFTASLTRYAVGHMTGAAVPYTELSPQSLASAVWQSKLAEYQEDGTAGKALGTASTGGVDVQAMANAVWSHAIESGFTAEEVTKLMASVLLGRASGAGTDTMKFLGLDDSTERVIANVDQVGNRQGVTLYP